MLYTYIFTLRALVLFTSASNAIKRMLHAPLVTLLSVTGILSKVDYLESLGVDGVWLSPFYESGGVDMGYDWTDHTAPDPRFGEDSDVDELFQALAARGENVVLL